MHLLLIHQTFPANSATWPPPGWPEGIESPVWAQPQLPEMTSDGTAALHTFGQHFSLTKSLESYEQLFKQLNPTG